MIGSTLTPLPLGRNSSRSTGTLVFKFSPLNTTLHGLSQWPVIPGTMLVTPGCLPCSRLVCRMSLLPKITKTFQDQAPSGIKSSVKRTYATCLQSPTSIDRTPLKDHGKIYYGSTKKSVYRGVCRNYYSPVSLIGSTTPIMQLQWTSLRLTVKLHGLGWLAKWMTLAIFSSMSSMIHLNTLPSPPGIIQLTWRRTRTKMYNTSALPITLPNSTPTILVPAQDVHFFYMRSHLSALQSCTLTFSTNFFFFTFK